MPISQKRIIIYYFSYLPLNTSLLSSKKVCLQFIKIPSNPKFIPSQPTRHIQLIRNSTHNPTFSPCPLFDFHEKNRKEENIT